MKAQLEQSEDSLGERASAERRRRYNCEWCCEWTPEEEHCDGSVAVEPDTAHSEDTFHGRSCDSHSNRILADCHHDPKITCSQWRSHTFSVTAFHCTRRPQGRQQPARVHKTDHFIVPKSFVKMVSNVERWHLSPELASDLWREVIHDCNSTTFTVTE